MGSLCTRSCQELNQWKTFPPSLERAFYEGKIDASDKKEILRVLKEGFGKGMPPSMFEEGWKVYNEKEILTPDGEYRPDRIMLKESSAVVIDYKFGQ